MNIEKNTHNITVHGNVCDVQDPHKLGTVQDIKNDGTIVVTWEDGTEGYYDERQILAFRNKQDPRYQQLVDHVRHGTRSQIKGCKWCPRRWGDDACNCRGGVGKA